MRRCIFNSEGPGQGFALCAYLTAQPDRRGHNRALGGAGTVKTRQPLGSPEPRCDDFHELIDPDVGREKGEQWMTNTSLSHTRFKTLLSSC